jgi:hypothetical protein
MRRVCTDKKNRFHPIKLVENSSKAASYEAGVYRIIATDIIIKCIASVGIGQTLLSGYVFFYLICQKQFKVF